MQSISKNLTIAHGNGFQQLLCVEVALFWKVPCTYIALYQSEEISVFHTCHTFFRRARVVRMRENESRSIYGESIMDMLSRSEQVLVTKRLYGQRISKADHVVPAGGLPHPSEFPTFVPATGHPCMTFDRTTPQPCWL